MLTPLTAQGFQFSDYKTVMYDRMKENVLKQASEKKVAMDGRHEAAKAYLQEQSERWIKVKSTVYTAKTAVDNAAEGVKEIKNLLLEMKSILSDIQNSTDTAYFQKQFDDKLAKLNQVANKYGKDNNLIGNTSKSNFSTVNDVEYRASLGATSYKLEGVNLSSEWYVEVTAAADKNGTLSTSDSQVGKVWVSESASKSMALYTTYSSDPANVSASTVNGISLGLYDGGASGTQYVQQNTLAASYSETASTDYEKTGTLTFTTQPEMQYDASADSSSIGRQYQGTLHRGGLQVMGNWFYEGLLTTDGRAQALSDINAALDKVGLAEGKIFGYQVMVESDSDKVDRQLDDIRAKSKALYIDQYMEQMDLDGETARNYQAVISNLDAVASTQSNYTSLFAGRVSNPFLGVTLDEFA